MERRGILKRGMENVSGTFFERRSECGDRRCAENALRNFPDFSSVKIPEVFLRNFSKNVLPRVRSMRQKRTRRCAFPRKIFRPSERGLRADCNFPIYGPAPSGRSRRTPTWTGTRTKAPLPQISALSQSLRGRGCLRNSRNLSFCIIDYSDVE